MKHHSDLLRLTLIVNEALQRQSVQVEIRLTNNSDRVLYISRRMRFIPEMPLNEINDLSFQVVDPHGTSIQPYFQLIPRITSVTPPVTDFVALQPLTVHSRIIELSEFFGFEEAGKYSVTVEYQNLYDGAEYGIVAWTGKIKSAEAVFNVLH